MKYGNGESSLSVGGILVRQSFGRPVFWLAGLLVGRSSGQLVFLSAGLSVVVVVNGRDIPGVCAGRLASYVKLHANKIGDYLWIGVFQCELMHVQVKPHSNPVDKQ
jgi:hypothetical protein